MEAVCHKKAISIIFHPPPLIPPLMAANQKATPLRKGMCGCQRLPSRRRMLAACRTKETRYFRWPSAGRCRFVCHYWCDQHSPLGTWREFWRGRRAARQARWRVIPQRLSAPIQGATADTGLHGYTVKSVEFHSESWFRTVFPKRFKCNAYLTHERPLARFILSRLEISSFLELAGLKALYCYSAFAGCLFFSDFMFGRELKSTLWTLNTKGWYLVLIATAPSQYFPQEGAKSMRVTRKLPH